MLIPRTASSPIPFIALALVVWMCLSWVLPVAYGLRGEARVSCFLLGNIHPFYSPFSAFFREDPLFEYWLEPLPANLDDDQRRRLDRLYYPRNRNQLLNSFDMIFFSDAHIQHFSSRQTQDLDYAFREAGMPSFFSFGSSWIHAFETSILREVLPIREYDFYFYNPHRVEFLKEREPVFLPFVELGIERVVGMGWAKVTPRQDATVWAEMVPVDYPWLVSWKPGGSNPGIVWVNGDEFDSYWWGMTNAQYKNPFVIDLAANLVLYSLGRPLIEDVYARREARLLLSQHNSVRLLVLSMLEWAERFGANTASVFPRLSELDEWVGEAIEDYVGQDYSTTITTMGSVSLTMNQITKEAVRLENEARFWVYVSEWCVITFTFLSAGFIVWSLMVRKRLYREVRETKLSSTVEI